jgi:hypothetical protein
VTAEPALSHFVPATSTLVSIARDVRAGAPVGVVVPNDRSLRIPTRALAERILAIVDKAPGPLGHEDAVTTKTMAILHNNLARAVVYAIIADYPDLMRH